MYTLIFLRLCDGLFLLPIQHDVHTRSGLVTVEYLSVWYYNTVS